MSARGIGAWAPALVAALLVASPAAAAGGEEAGGWDLALRWVNLLLLLGVLVYAARRPISVLMADRRDKIRDDIDSAAELLRQAETRHTEWQRKLVQLEEELDEIRATARRRASEERERILAEARELSERIERDAMLTVEQELRRAQEELRDEAAVLATELAARILAEKVTDSDRDRLLDEFILRIEQTGPTDGPRR